MTRQARLQPVNAVTFSAACALAMGALLSSPAACSSGSTRPSLISTGGENQTGGGHSGTGTGGSGNAENAGASADGGDTSAAGDPGSAGSAGDSTAGAGPTPVGPSTCSLTAIWSTAISVAGVSTAAKEVLLSVTPDELDLAFLRAGVLYVAHRGQASASFDPGAAVPIPSGWSAAQGAALSADGKRLILISSPDQKKLGELRRATRNAAFSGEIEESAFAALNQDSVYTGKLYASPAVSPGDDQLFFNSSYPSAESTVVVSTRTATDAWSAPKQLMAGVFDGSPGKRRLPTGVSADLRTLFYFNEESANEEARFRSSASSTAPLYDMQSLGKRRGAMPNSACDRLYSESDSDVVVEKD